MDRWIFPIIAIVFLSVTSMLLARLTTKRTGRTTHLSATGRILVGVGIAAVVIGSDALFDLDLPWLMVVAGGGGAFVALAVQPFFGKPAP